MKNNLKVGIGPGPGGGHRLPSAFTAVLLIGAMQGTAYAAEWYVRPSITQSFTYDDNIRFQTTDETSAYGFITAPRIQLEAHTPRSDLSVGALLAYAVYPSESSLNYFNQRLDAAGSYRTERSRFDLGAVVQNAATLTTEDEDTGEVSAGGRRVSFSLGPSWGYVLSERDTVGLRGGASYVHYTTDQLDDYLTYFVGPFWSRRLTERDVLELSASYRRYDRQSGPSLDSDLYSGQVSLTHVFTPTFQGSVYGGGFYQHMKQDVAGVSQTNDDAGYLGGISVTYQAERAQLSGGFDRNVAPSGVGQLLVRNRGWVAFDYDLTPTIVFNLGTVYIDQSPAEDDPSLDRNFFSVSPGIRWHFLPEWNLGVWYRFRTQELADSGERAYSNAVNVALTWQLPVVQPGGPR